MEPAIPAHFASVCLLSYQRPDHLKRSLHSLLNTDPGFPMELIVNDDGSDPEVKDCLYELLRSGRISYLILNGGKNMGIGKSIQNCFRVASGDYLFKCDADLEYKPEWLKTAVTILDQPEVGCVSLFNYRHYSPHDDRFNVLREYVGFYEVDDIVSSIYGVKRIMFERYGDVLGEDGWHQYIKGQNYKLAISKEDMVTNFGFGLGNSIFVEEKSDGSIGARGFSKYPAIFH